MLILDLLIGLAITYIGVRWLYAVCLEVVDCIHCYKNGYRNNTYFGLVLLDLLFSITIMVWGCKILTGIKWAI